MIGAALRIALPLAFLALSACGHAGVRREQDWSTVEDERLLRTVHVGDHGSGVAIAARRDEGLFVLTNSHVVGSSDSVAVWLPSRSRGWSRFAARVVARAHADKVDLALLLVEGTPPMPEFSTELAAPLRPGEVREVAMMAVTLPGGPRSFTLRAVDATGTYVGAPDDFGATSYEVSRACAFGRLRSANSGSPVFDGPRLFGLHELSPLRAEIPAEDGPRAVHGLGISTPGRIRAFLEAHLRDDLVASPNAG